VPPALFLVQTPRLLPHNHWDASEGSHFDGVDVLKIQGAIRRDGRKSDLTVQGDDSSVEFSSDIPARSSLNMDHDLRPDLGRIPDPQLKLKPAERSFKPAGVSTRFHP
jgi:hypothetical protein